MRKEDRSVEKVRVVRESFHIFPEKGLHAVLVYVRHSTYPVNIAVALYPSHTLVYALVYGVRTYEYARGWGLWFSWGVGLPFPPVESRNHAL